MSTPSDTMRTATIHGIDALGEVLDARRRGGVVAERQRGGDAVAAAHEVDDAAGVLVVHGDHQAAGVGLHRRGWPAAAAWAWSSTAGSHSPPTDSAVRRRWPDAGAVEGVVEGGGVLLAVGADPLHVPVDAGEVDGPHDAAVVQRLAVAVLVVGVGLAEVVVVDEGDGGGVGAERRARERQAPGGVVEGQADAVAPGPVVAGVVQLVEDHEGVAGDAPQRVRAAWPPAGR